jgi:hypothetical protein
MGIMPAKLRPSERPRSQDFSATHTSDGLTDLGLSMSGGHYTQVP